MKFTHIFNIIYTIVAWFGISLFMLVQVLPFIMKIFLGDQYNPSGPPPDLNTLAIICLIILAARDKA